MAAHIQEILSVTALMLTVVIIISMRTEAFANYIKCGGAHTDPDVRGLAKEVLDKYNVTRVYDKKGWDLYYPCNYTHVERELQERVQCNGRRLQSVYAVDGCDRIVSKNALWKILENHYGRNVASTIVPSTYILQNEHHVALFLQQYRRDALYILKKNLQRKEGLLLTGNLEAILRGNVKGYKVVQQYMPNVHLVGDRKLNLRLYVLIVCGADGVKRAYLHRDGKCMYTNKPYQRDSIDFEHQITSVGLEPTVYDTLPLTLGELRTYWHARNISYAEVYGRIFTKMQLVARALLPHVCNSAPSNCEKHVRFQLFGADIILTDTMDPFLLEFNKGPNMVPINARDDTMKRAVLEDTFSVAGVIRLHNRENGYTLL